MGAPAQRERIRTGRLGCGDLRRLRHFCRTQRLSFTAGTLNELSTNPSANHHAICIHTENGMMKGFPLLSPLLLLGRYSRNAIGLSPASSACSASWAAESSTCEGVGKRDPIANTTTAPIMANHVNWT